MSTVQDVKVPDIGDFKDVEIIEVHVKAGDAVSADSPLITLDPTRRRWRFHRRWKAW